MTVGSAGVRGCVQHSAPRQHRATGASRCFRAGSALVLADDRRLVLDRVSGLPEPGTQILVLAVHEEALVEAADLLERSAANQEAGARDPVDGAGLGVRTRISDHLVDPARARHEPLQEERPRIRRAQAGEPAQRVVESARRGRRARAQEPRPPGAPPPAARARDGVRGHAGVGVEEEDVRRRRRAPAHVAAGAEPTFSVSGMVSTGRSAIIPRCRRARRCRRR